MPGEVKRTKRPSHRYADEFKRKIAKEYLSGQASYGVLAEEHGLRDKGVVKEFVKWYRRKGELGEEKTLAMPRKKQPDNTSAAQGQEPLQEQIKELERQLALSQLKVEALETMIDIAETELKIDIRKKSGAKQWKK